MKVYLVCYDISDDDVRQDVANLLGEYGERVQRSVFEVIVRTETELAQLQQRLAEALGDEPELRFYRLCERCRSESRTLTGERVAVFPSTIIV
ncbi:MAG: CRISPR-associated endonuclease Cas2 [Gammaproteobacteria bacterium]